MSDKRGVSRFLDDAVRIFETAVTAGAEAASNDFGILLDGSGGLRIVEAAGWNPEALRVHHGASALYRVTRRGAELQVTGSAPGHSCLLRAEAPPAHRLNLGTSIPQYTLVQSALPA